MTDIDLKELRKLAESATAGPWRECGSARGGCTCGQVWSTYADMPVATAEKGDEEFGPIPEALTKANAAYIAAANPAALLSLLSRLEEAEKDTARLNWLGAKCTGASDSERYLPFRVYWGSDGAKKGMRVQLDKAIAASPHISGSQEQEGK